MKLKIKRSAPKIKIVRKSRYYSLHTHSRYSANDALSTVSDIVKRAKELRYPALGLTDHGNMAGTVQLYQECMKAGIKPLPGTELYIVRDREDKKAKRYHACVVAYTNQGYKNLVRMNTRMHQQFHFKPLLDLADLAEMAENGQTEGLAITTGCYFGLVVQTLITDGYDAAKAVVRAFSQWFPGSTYVELQRHNIDQEPMSETEISNALVQIADELGLHCVITQDSHYVMPEDKHYHETLKTLVTWSDNPDEAKFPGDDFALVDEAWMRDHHGDHYQRGIAGLEDLLAKHTLTIPELDEYEYNVPFTVADPQHELSVRCQRRLLDLDLAKPRYLERLNDELDVVRAADMSGYLLLVAEVTDYCRDQQIFFQARGSAAGSLICYLLGITPVDPLKWGLIMERFLSKDRTKPPDVDLDIESTRRIELMEWLAGRFATLQIGNWLTYSMAGDDEGKGSLKVKMLSAMRKVLNRPVSWDEVSTEDKKRLYELADMKLISGPGVHAAGVLLTSTRQELEELVPQMYIPSSKTFVSQYDMKDVEKLGLVKLDVLGLKTMTVLRMTIENMERSPADGLDFIPLNDSSTYTMLCRGDTAGVFQLEGGTATRGVRELKPNKIKDIIAAMALYRPATMNSGATDAYVSRKHGQQAVPSRHEIILKYTKDTYGILLYQEQVISVLRELGLNPDELTAFLKAVKASNQNVADAEATIRRMMHDQIKVLCDRVGMTKADFDWLTEALLAYANYGFNSAHATVYGITAYRCAWLAKNHPVEFHAALLAVSAGTKKEPDYIRATRNRGVRVLRPDVNLSGASYQMDPSKRGVRKGLVAIKGVGLKAAEAIVAEQPYADLADFAARSNPRPVTGVKDMKAALAKGDANGLFDVGTVSKLHEAGAFDSLMEK